MPRASFNRWLTALAVAIGTTILSAEDPGTARHRLRLPGRWRSAARLDSRVPATAS